MHVKLFMEVTFVMSRVFKSCKNCSLQSPLDIANKYFSATFMIRIRSDMTLNLHLKKLMGQFADNLRDGFRSIN